MSDIDKLFATLTNLQQQKRLPPIHLWQPERVGEIDIRIDRKVTGTTKGLRLNASP